MENVNIWHMNWEFSWEFFSSGNLEIILFLGIDYWTKTSAID